MWQEIGRTCRSVSRCIAVRVPVHRTPLFCYACMLVLVVLDLVFICNGLVCFFCVSLDHFGFLFSNLVLLGLVFFSIQSQYIGWEKRLQNDLFCVEWT